MALPLILSPFLALSKLISPNPQSYSTFIRVMIAASSCILIPATFAVSKKIYQSSKISLLTASTTAIWYEFIYFSSRALSEVISLNLLALSCLLMLSKKVGEKRSLLAGLVVGLSYVIRFQHLTIIGVTCIWLVVGAARKNKSWFVVGVLTSVIAGGILDLLYTGRMFAYPISLISLTITHNLSTIFGISPWWYYPRELIIVSWGLFLLPLRSLKRSSKSFLPTLIVLSIIVLYSFVPHKEYRFIYQTIPLIMMIVCANIYQITNKSLKISLSIVITISFLGILNVFPLKSVAYPHKIMSNDAYLQNMHQLYTNESVCGIFDTTRWWPGTGGLYHVGKNIPMYTIDYPPSNTDYANTTISSLDGTITINIQDKNCRVDPNYSFKRSFQELEAKINPDVKKESI